MKKTFVILILLIFAVTISSCKKYLDAKPDKSLQIPTTVTDLQALLDHGTNMGENYGVSFGESSADNYYMTDNQYNQMNQENRNTYIWANQNYTNYPNDWAYLYNVINIANIVLDNIKFIESNPQNPSEWNNTKGSALFFRGYSLLQGAFIFCKAYDESTAENDYGMALRLTSDFNAPTTRANLKQTYQRIMSDLKEASALLPDSPAHPLRPSKSSSFAMIARAYLSMRSYDSCFKYADLALKIKNDLMDYNTLSITASFPFSRFNIEDMFSNAAGQPNYYTSSSYYALVDSSLYQSYDNNDLRKALFFKEEPDGYSFKGSYAGYYAYIGIATDEAYLMRAESYARLGNKEASLNDLNNLMETRWAQGTFVPFTAATSEIALGIILNERRKELIFRDLRWMDIKRLNIEGAGISLTRVIDGKSYTLHANDNRFALSLPADIVKMNGIPQNPF